MAGIDPGGVVDAILSSEELQNGLVRALTASERCTPPGTRQNETVPEEVSAIFCGNNPAAQTTPLQSGNVSVSNWPIFEMHTNYVAVREKGIMSSSSSSYWYLNMSTTAI